MAITHVGSDAAAASGGGMISLTCPVTQAGDLLIVEQWERSGNTSSISGLTGVTWNSVTISADANARLWWGIATGNHSGAGITISNTGYCAQLNVYRGVFQADPLKAATLVSESNASGNETQAQITTLYDGAMVVLTVGTNNDVAINSQSCTTPGALTERTQILDTAFAGITALAHASAIMTTAGNTGSFTWSQTNAAGVSWAYALMPNPWPVTVTGNQAAPSGTIAKKYLKSLAGNQPAASGALADITIIPGGVTLAGNQPNATGTVVSTRFKSLAGSQPAATGTVVGLFKNKLLAGNQPNATGALTVRRTLTHIALAGNQPNATGAIAAIKTQFKSLAGNQPAGSGALAFDIILRHITLAGNQPAGSGTIAAVRAKFISLAGNQPNATGTLVALFKNKLLQGAQAAPSGSLAFDRLLSHIALAGNQPAASGAIAAVAATFVDLAGNQPAASGALVALFTSKLLQGNQPNATGVLAALHLAFVALAGDQPAGSGTIVGVAPIRNYTPSPYGGSARATLQPPGASGRVTDVRPGPGSVRTNNPPNRGSGRFTP